MSESKRPDPATLAEASYILAIASVLILLLAYVLSWSGAVGFLSRIVWLALITSAAGAFLAYAARKDYERIDAPEADVKRARAGWRVNLAVLVLMLVLAAIAIAVGLLGRGAAG